MSAIFNRAAAAVFIEFTENAAHLAADNRTLDIAIERDASGSIKADSANSVRDALKLFSASAPPKQAWCLLPARGVSIRRISLPAASKEDIDRLLPLQIDAQFPLSSEELAWGYRALARPIPTAGGNLKELLVAAVKKDSLKQYRDILMAAGFEPIFGIAALSREGICPARPGHSALLEIGANQSELITFDESGPSALRVVPLGDDKNSSEPLLTALRSNGSVEKLFVSGKEASIWSARITPQIPAEAMPTVNGQSTAIAGLRETLRRGIEPLLIQNDRLPTRIQRTPAQWRWAAVACALLLVSIALRFVDPLIRKARIQSSIAQLEARRARLPKINREAAFLAYIHENQPDYLDIIGALASATQPGMKLDSLTLSRRGEVGMRGSAQGAQAPGALRSKMLESGYFANVVIDEQTPNQQNQQQVAFRMTAQLRPEAERKAFLANKPKPEKSATNKTATASGPPPAGPPVSTAPESAAKPGELPTGVVIRKEATPQ